MRHAARLVPASLEEVHDAGASHEVTPAARQQDARPAFLRAFDRVRRYSVAAPGRCPVLQRANASGAPVVGDLAVSGNRHDPVATCVGAGRQGQLRLASPRGASV